MRHLSRGSSGFSWKPHRGPSVPSSSSNRGYDSKRRADGFLPSAGDLLGETGAGSYDSSVGTLSDVMPFPPGQDLITSISSCSAECTTATPLYVVPKSVLCQTCNFKMDSRHSPTPITILPGAVMLLGVFGPMLDTVDGLDESFPDNAIL